LSEMLLANDSVCVTVRQIYKTEISTY